MKLGEILFNIWRRHATDQFKGIDHGPEHNGIDLPKHGWKDLPPKSHERWEAIAKEFLSEAVNWEFD